MPSLLAMLNRLSLAVHVKIEINVAIGRELQNIGRQREALISGFKAKTKAQTYFCIRREPFPDGEFLRETVDKKPYGFLNVPFVGLRRGQAGLPATESGNGRAWPRRTRRAFNLRMGRLDKQKTGDVLRNEIVGSNDERDGKPRDWSTEPYRPWGRVFRQSRIWLLHKLLSTSGDTASLMIGCIE